MTKNKQAPPQEASEALSPWVSRAGLFGGPLLAILVWFVWQPATPQPTYRTELRGRAVFRTETPASTTSSSAQRAAAAVAVLVAVWWLTEAMPMAVAALVPLIMFPLLGVLDIKRTAAAYGDENIFLFLGGFFVALAIEETGLHKRIALRIVAAMGDNPRRIILGFMLATGLWSMWMSNTSITMLMLPIGISLLSHVDKRAADARFRRNFGTALMLGIAYAASIGGMATLVGTPPNLAFKSIYFAEFGQEIGFVQWMAIALPFSLVFLLICWWMMSFWLFPVGFKSMMGGSGEIADELKNLGPMSVAEKRAGLLFGCTALLWVFRAPLPGFGWGPLLEQLIANSPIAAAGTKIQITDAMVAVFMGIWAFVIPRGDRPGETLAHWKSTQRLPWGMLLLFGGGLALAAGMSATKLDVALGAMLKDQLEGSSLLLQTAMVALGITAISEVASNLATVQMMLPVLAQTCRQMGIAPLTLMVPATLAASCGFALPVATPPNALVFGTGRIRVGQMLKAGLCLDAIGVVLIVITMAIVGIFA